MEFLPLSRRRSSARNVPSYEERGETDVFAGYWLWNTYPFVPSSNSEICIRCFCDLASELMSLSICSNTWTTSENIVGHRGVRCWAEMRSIRTLKKRKICSWTTGDWGSLKLSAWRSCISGRQYWYWSTSLQNDDNFFRCWARCSISYQKIMNLILRKSFELIN